jgi:hypothetical protein
MTVHLHTPVRRNLAACGDAKAKRFTMWRWQCSCRMCMMLTAPRPFDTATKQEVIYRADLPLRYSRLVEHVRKHAPLPNVEEAIAEFERDRTRSAHCPKHGALADPIALMDVPNNRMVFACPDCVEPQWRARWERER